MALFLGKTGVGWIGIQDRLSLHEGCGPVLMKVLLIHNRYLCPGGEDAVVAAEKALLCDYNVEVECFELNNSDIVEGGAIRVARALKYPLNAARLASKALSGAYTQKMPLPYAVFASEDASGRTCFEEGGGLFSMEDAVTIHSAKRYTAKAHWLGGSSYLILEK